MVNLLANQAVVRGHDVLVVDSDESNSGLFRMLGFQHLPTPLMTLVGSKNKLKEKMGQPNILVENRITVEAIPSQYLVNSNGIKLEHRKDPAITRRLRLSDERVES